MFKAVAPMGAYIFERIISYRVFDPSCHPQISLCARIQKKTESWTGQPLKWPSPGLATPKKWQSPELATSKLTRIGTLQFFGGPELSHFRGWPVQDSCFFFWILAHREVWGWQEGSNTLYKPLLLSSLNNCHILGLTMAGFNLACMKTKVLLPPWK